MKKDKIITLNGTQISLTDSNHMDHLKQLSLEAKESIAKKVISTAVSGSNQVFILFDGGLDTLVALHLVRHLYNQKILFPVLHIDTSVKFKEIYQYINKMSKLWGFDLVTARNDKTLKTLDIAEDPKSCCKLLKSETLAQAVKKFNINLLITGARHKQDKTEVFISQKTDCTMVNPLLCYTEQDVSDYIRKFNLPCCSLYNRGHRDIDCEPCTKRPDTLKEDAQDNAEVRKKLKALGYLG